MKNKIVKLIVTVLVMQFIMGTFILAQQENNEKIHVLNKIVNALAEEADDNKEAIKTIVIEDAKEKLSKANEEEIEEIEAIEELENFEEVEVIKEEIPVKKGLKEIDFEINNKEDITPIDIIMNSVYLKMDVKVLNNKTYVSLRKMLETITAKDIIFDEENYTVTANVKDVEYKFLINTNNVIKEKSDIEMKNPTIMYEGQVMICLEDYLKLIDFKIVEFDKLYQTYILSDPNFSVSKNYQDIRKYTFDEVKLFSKLVMKEAGAASFECKHGVASVVMNQLNYGKFGDTITEIIFFVAKVPHFPPAYKAGFKTTIPNSDSVKAVKNTLRGENSAGACIFFNTRPFKGKKIYKVVDGVYFCY